MKHERKRNTFTDRSRNSRLHDLTLRFKCLTFAYFLQLHRDIAGRMRNQLYPMRLASYVDKNAQIIKDATVAGQSAMKSAQEATQVRIGNN